MSAYVCRVHSSQPVTWRGTGCRICAKSSDERQRDEDTAAMSQMLSREFYRQRDQDGEA